MIGKKNVNSKNKVFLKRHFLYYDVLPPTPITHPQTQTMLECDKIGLTCRAPQEASLPKRGEQK